MRVYVDDDRRLALENGEEKAMALSPGLHSIAVEIGDKYVSRPLQVDCVLGRSPVIECDALGAVSYLCRCFIDARNLLGSGQQCVLVVRLVGDASA